MIIASIDIGTNTVLLLLAKVNSSGQTFSTILNEYRMPRLGKDLKPGGNISTYKIETLFNILGDYQKIIDNHKTDKIIITATNAFRIAANSNEIIRQIKDKFGYDVNIISGETESEYAFYGAIPESANNKLSLVIDIGGGSTELITGKNNKIYYRKSFQVGSVSATENYLKHFPPAVEDLDLLDSALSKVFDEIKNKIAPDLTIAVAGTPTTLYCMIKELKEFDESLVEGNSITFAELKRLLKELQMLTPEQVNVKYGNVMRGREDIILGGALILLKIMELLKISNVVVSARGIRYGAIQKYLTDHKKISN